jgi:hypothetical protein
MYQGFNDMIDGGGAGASGQSFEGGGLLSMIANMIASPRGSQQGQPEPMGGLLSPRARPAMPVQAPQYSGRGDFGMQPPSPTQNPHPQMFQPPMQPRQNPHPPMPPLGFEQFVAGFGEMAQGVSPEVLREAYRLHMSGYGQ